MTQENSMWTVSGLVERSPIPPRQFFLKLLQTRPALLDKLLDCATLPLPEWYPESQVAGISCEILAVIFQFPLSSVPGLSFPLQGRLKTEQEEGYEATLAALRILISRPNWRSKMLNIWKNLEALTYQEIFRYALTRYAEKWLSYYPSKIF